MPEDFRLFYYYAKLNKTFCLLTNNIKLAIVAFIMSSSQTICFPCTKSITWINIMYHSERDRKQVTKSSVFEKLHVPDKPRKRTEYA